MDVDGLPRAWYKKGYKPTDSMAFVFKNKNTVNWLAGFRDVTGKRRNRSTGLVATERNKRKAEQIADEYESAARNKRTAQQVRRTICSLHRELTGEDMPVITMRLHVEQWLRSKKTSVSEKTVDFYSGACRNSFPSLEKMPTRKSGKSPVSKLNCSVMIWLLVFHRKL